MAVAFSFFPFSSQIHHHFSAAALGKAADQVPLFNVGFHDSARDESLGGGQLTPQLGWAEFGDSAESF